ncbi:MULTISPECIES: DUF1853 family protein [unclassified Polaribacter]|uniref:DUF1853 family protein n=1 Tax=unclassified Polaribacter TaxID=196858 RepID=UPI0011BD53F4|nr:MULTISPECIES: DUF1853 family protein [unclassified Polaribacter]TXD52589.1 DUF1853 family protein [Polaribacter sp. IC063]TXD61850.1 DUF1853 family protein [Polaribacter sp. IC066]
MHQKTKDIQKRYDGFLQTPCLWKNDAIFELNQFDIKEKSSKINIAIDERLRLGRYIERFVSYQLEQENTIDILCENVQIQQEKRTLGELDCILLKNGNPIHLEIIYKFYVYDSSVGNTEIAHFIGPNRKDSLVEKLTKLKNKQLPLLYANECVNYLKSIDLKSTEITQKVYFKAQLFVPFANSTLQLTSLNNECISGFYVNQKELKQFYDSKFYIPIKKDWLVQPHQNVDWLNFQQFKNDKKEYLERNFSPLCWLKKPNGEIEKFFLVWWN